ncbi:PepSY domain-containing protein [Cytobacillus kochii]|uniref:PepSY domain-containing protein n=1 Tax=Cytobacillus kochii TaxID=859143 RepID=UPI00203DFADD|nr:PepSY domain-containing protein [Cytobacillus kochii]MCM3322576.1 PepSY domain-containing protein [Cytobacillus kochii]MCM3344945.1 PepSY domain-containing protein [Cytobacillus kochii]
MRRKGLWITLGLVVIATFIIIVTWQGVTTSAKTITKDDALSLIEERYKGSKVTNIELQQSAYHIKMTRESGIYEVSLNAENGDIISLKKLGDNSSGGDDRNKTIKNEKEIESILLLSSDDILSISKKTENQKDVYVAKVLENKEEYIVKVDAVTGSIVSKDKAEKTKEEKPKEENPKEENPEEGKQKEEDRPVAISKDEAIKIALEHVKGAVDDDIEIENIGGQTYYLIEIETDDDNEATVQVHTLTGKATISFDD